MAQRPQSPHDEQYPEVVPHTPTFHVYDSSFEYYQPQTSPAPEYIPPQRSPAPEYQAYSRSPPLSSQSPQLSSFSPRISSSSPPPLGSAFGHSPSTSDSGWKIRTPPVQYSEFQSPDPQAVYVPPAAPIQSEKEYYNKAGAEASVVASPPADFQVPRKPVNPQHAPAPEPERKKPIYKRPLWIILAIVAIVVVVVAVVCGVVLGTKKHKSPPPPPPTPAPNVTVITGDPNISVGGYLSPSYYSHSGAWNGSGVALAAANPGVDQTIYVFYQDFKGDIQWKLKYEDGTFSDTFGKVNDPNGKRPLNGTPISVVNHAFSSTNLVYHLFFIDEDYYVVERRLETGKVVQGSALPLWGDGYLAGGTYKTLEADSIGLQACLWNNYDGGYDVNYVYATSAIQLWYASSETQFKEYSWTNGTTQWKFEQNWDGLSGYAGVGCQTWDSWATEYVFFVDTDQNMAVYWRDNNASAPSTQLHPTLEWVKIKNVSIPDVHKSSSLGYTTYMLYQDDSNVIRGANISWGAENTTIATSSSTGQLDMFEIEDLNTNKPVVAIRGTHLSITALKTSSGGASLEVYFQQEGDDMAMYTRDMNQVNGLWQVGQQAVNPNSS